MLTVPALPDTPSETASGAMKRLAPRKSCLSSRRRLAVLAAIASAAVYSGYPSFSTAGALAASSAATGCAVDGAETTCTCGGQVGETGKNWSAILSKKTNILTLKCGEQMQCVPQAAGGHTVCSATTPELASCNLDLHTLLAGETSDVTWKDCSVERNATGKCLQLTIPEGNLPHVDGMFAVGCTGAPRQPEKCRVAVTVEARPSVTEGQTVTCAYGASSNPTRQAVTLSPTQNSFTLVCGDKGEVLPKNYEDVFCSSELKGDQDVCKGDYTSILQAYQKNWWEHDKKANVNSYKLSIPVDKFPTEQSKIVVGCQQKESSSEEMKTTEDASRLPEGNRILAMVQADHGAAAGRARNGSPLRKLCNPGSSGKAITRRFKPSSDCFGARLFSSRKKENVLEHITPWIPSPLGNAAQQTRKCNVAVTVEARKSETAGQIITCAYGANSNESRQALILNPSKDSFTLVCGEKGTVLPANYETSFCSSDPEKAKETCDGDYQSILPGFENGWWKKEEPTSPNSFTLSIPVEEFPKEQAKMLVGCRQTEPKPEPTSGKGAEEVTSVSPACTASVSETTCTCSDPAAAASAAAASESKQSATLSKDTNILSVNCSGDLQFAPTRDEDTMVCSATAEDLQGCNVDIRELLFGEPKDVKWKQCEAQEEKSIPKCKALTIPQDNLPFVDESFAVGCATVNNGKVCKIPVTMKARASETNGQTVTCAYGADSNTSRQAVTLSPSKNSFTLVCGDKGTVLPTNYDTKFCYSDPDDTSTTCDGDYESILPGFESSWWKKERLTAANSFTLSIPVEKFPKEQAKMVVACQQEKEGLGSKTVQGEAATSSVCTVDVTIQAGSPASLSLGSWHFSSWLLAFAVALVMARGV
ncbi:hypothetical protein BESB_057410 [Besnoitia besnoiti]|uniref:SRS domain-containing protein n=1 Tax=Besnoitia besnoiti TaxID=94643 RepID=A0A2A9MKX4_BESBE|nr:hypothetical protein BESB_057410 [Besnoitia besnoiti]PFH36090.1 hypothetical protein BESB_057410 [Besnoitia besnoiti]